MPSSPYSCVLWDVDGTIVDASVGILRRLNIALTHFGHPAPTREELVHWIGPPMFQSFQDQEVGSGVGVVGDGGTPFERGPIYPRHAGRRCRHTRSAASTMRPPRAAFGHHPRGVGPVAGHNDVSGGGIPGGSQPTRAWIVVG